MNYYGHYRGKVIDNTGDIGKCKIYVPSIYPDKINGIESTNETQYATVLPWAEPAMPIFAGNKDGQGMCSWPEIGAIVWIFFEGGDISSPVYFAGTHGGGSWNSVSTNQYVIQSEKVKITLDDSETSNSAIHQESYGDSAEVIHGKKIITVEDLNEQPDTTAEYFLKVGDSLIQITDGKIVLTNGKSTFMLDGGVISADSAGFIQTGTVDLAIGDTGMFATPDGKLVTVSKGIVTSISE